jgi:hypothetical protein
MVSPHLSSSASMHKTRKVWLVRLLTLIAVLGGWLYISDSLYKSFNDYSLLLTPSKALSSTTDETKSQEKMPPYQPSWAEQYILDNADRLGFNPDDPKAWIKGCTIWQDRKLEPKLFDKLHQFINELSEYNRLVKVHPVMDDNRKRLLQDPDACNALELHPDGLPGLFPSQQLSWTPFAGWVEPLFPPFRHPHSLCWNPPLAKILDRSYMVHDYAHMCRQLKPHSRTILIDMGAALDFHVKPGEVPPPIQFYNEFRQAGFHFDHIYALELNSKDPNRVFQVLPADYMFSFHWINIGVNTSEYSHANPLYNIILKHCTVDDFVVIKLDIDTSELEMALIHQLINDPRLHGLVDVLYFEHHVRLEEIARHWGHTCKGTLKYSLEIFRQLRDTGIAAHYWI